MENRKKGVIFGAGERGIKLYQELSLFVDVIAYSDNNQQLWGQLRNGTAILPPCDLPNLVRQTGAAIFIASELYYPDIAEQLDDLGLPYYHCDNNLCYERENGIWYPVSLGRAEAYRKDHTDSFAVLFVQDKPCARTNRIAEALKKRGVLTYAAYTVSPSDAGRRAYIEEFPFWTYADLLSFVNESEFDIIHCSNSPDMLASVLVHSNKNVIHDCHDIVTAEKRNVHPAETVLEYLANTQADGVMAPTEQVRDILIRKYRLQKEKILVVGNYPLSSFGQVEHLPKLSAEDGEIHCVYEGTIVDNSNAQNMRYRFYEPIFIQLAQMGIHVHIYSSNAPEYLTQLDRSYCCIHYEGNYSGQKLITKLTQYDVGICLCLSTGLAYPDITSPNKIFEYLMAGLPVATNIMIFAELLSANSCGGMLDLDHDDIPSKLLEYQKLFIPPDFCDTHGFTMESNAERILTFYRKVMSS